MRLRVTSDFDGVELAKALVATAHAHGVGEHVEELAKSAKKPLENPERWAREAEEVWIQRLPEALADACEVVSRGVPTLQKARMAELDWSDYDTLLSVAKLVQDAISGALGALSDADRSRWREAGVILPDDRLHPSFGDLLRGGVLSMRGDASDQHTLNQLSLALARVGWNQGTRLAAEWMQQHGARHVQWFAATVGNDALTTMRQHQGASIGHAIGDMIQGKLKPTNNERVTQPSKRAVQSWRSLSTELYHEFKDSAEIDRDWRRVAASESRIAANAGRLLGLQQMGIQEVWFYVHKNACDGCKKVYLNDDDTPKVFKLQTILDHFWANDGMNVGRKASLIGEEGGWLPVGGVLHPFCRCRVMHKARGD